MLTHFEFVFFASEIIRINVFASTGKLGIHTHCIALHLSVMILHWITSCLGSLFPKVTRRRRAEHNDEERS